MLISRSAGLSKKSAPMECSRIGEGCGVIGVDGYFCTDGYFCAGCPVREIGKCRTCRSAIGAALICRGREQSGRVAR